jgi:hypothetical protein
MNRDTVTAQANTWANPSIAQIEAFFRDQENFQPGIRVAAIIYSVGKYDSEDDWDLGRFVYEWRRSQFRVRVCTKSDYVIRVEVLDPGSCGRFDSEIEILWQHPTNHDSF